MNLCEMSGDVSPKYSFLVCMRNSSLLESNIPPFPCSLLIGALREDVMDDGGQDGDDSVSDHDENDDDEEEDGMDDGEHTSHQQHQQHQQQQQMDSTVEIPQSSVLKEGRPIPLKPQVLTVVSVRLCT